MPQARQLKTRVLGSSSDFVSDVADKKTAAFVKKVLCPDQDNGPLQDSPLEALLPPLTSSNELDLQLYAFIAIILNEHVNTWYNKITPDKEFVREVIQIVAHCTRGVEQRFRKVDVVEFLFQDVPALLDAHVQAWRFAARAGESGRENPVADIEAIYHTLRPHPALSSRTRQSLNGVHSINKDMEYRQLLAEGILAILLPLEDLQNPCLFALVSDVLADLVLGKLFADRLCEPHQLYDLLIKGVETFHRRLANELWMGESFEKDETKGYSEKDVSPAGSRDDMSPRSPSLLERLGVTLTGIATGLLLLLAAARSLILLAFSSSHIPQRMPSDSSSSGATATSMHQQESKSQVSNKTSLLTYEQAERILQPMMSFKIWSAMAHWVRVDERLPPLFNVVSMFKRFVLEGAGRVGCTNAPLDRIGWMFRRLFERGDGIFSFSKCRIQLQVARC